MKLWRILIAQHWQSLNFTFTYKLKPAQICEYKAKEVAVIFARFNVQQQRSRTM